MSARLFVGEIKKPRTSQARGFLFERISLGNSKLLIGSPSYLTICILFTAFTSPERI